MKEKTDIVPELTRISSKGQLVIPKDIRTDMHIREGSVFAVSSPKPGMIILKKIDNPILRGDLAILNEVEEAWKEIESGKAKTMDAKDFLEELNKW